MKKRTPLSELVIDPDLIRMRGIDAHAVSRYRQHYRQGVDLGTILIERGTMRVVSGNHRVTAMRAEFGEDHEITVEAVKFDSEADLLKRFAEENKAHGMPLSGKSRAAIIQRLYELDTPEEEISRLFDISVNAVRRRAGQVVLVRGKGNSEQIMPAKAGIGAENRTMSQAEYERHWTGDVGVKPYWQAEQLADWLRKGRVDLTDDRTRSALIALRDVLVGAEL